jgi:hypothetical protein
MFKVTNGNTLDQHVAQNHDTPYKTLNLGAQKHDDRGHIYKGGQNVTLDEDPYSVFDRVFSGDAIDPQIFERQRQRNASILDYVGNELDKFSTIVGTEDRERIQFHINSIGELEKRLASGQLGVGGRPESLPENKFDVRDVSQFHNVTRAQLDLISLALASDVTRVATLLLGDGDGSNLATPWLGPEFALDTGVEYLGIRNSHHTHSHLEDDMHSTMQRWFVDEFVEFINKLKATPDPFGGKLFDNSVVLVMNNMNTGGGHGTNNLPIFVAGSAGYLQTGRYLKGGRDQNGILASVAAAVGSPIDGFEEFAEMRI